MSTIDWVVVSMTIEIENNNYLENAPGSCGVERLLDDESLASFFINNLYNHDGTEGV